MSKKEKLISRFTTLPKDFTWNELKALLESFGFEEFQAGKTSGSRVRFYQENYPPILIHKPHPGKILKLYQMKIIKEYLEIEDFL
jgi:hypothetical protein